MSSKALRYGLVAALLGIAAYWYWSPLLAIHQMRAAAKAGDADAFSDHVDYPRLRESLKGQFAAAFAEQAASKTPQSDAGRAGAVVGTMLGMVMVDKLVDTFVRPETVMRAMQEGKLAPKTEQPGGAPEPGRNSTDGVTWSSERKGVDRYITYATRTGEAEGNRVGLVFERTGFANWKLTEIRLPAIH